MHSHTLAIYPLHKPTDSLDNDGSFDTSLFIIPSIFTDTMTMEICTAQYVLFY